MACYHPITGYRSKALTSSGKRKLVFNIKQAIDDGEVLISCGQCIGCRISYSKQWAIRCMHESSLYEENSFITLTYNPENLPYPPSLDKSHFQLFMKRLRRKLKNKKIRYYHCGEYGEETNRPHYHAILFGHDFEDKIFYKKSYNGDIYYTSEILNKIWGKGNCIIGEVTFESVAYTARYIMKKVNGDRKEEHYKCTDPDTGELFDIEPEYTTMSKGKNTGKGKGGIGAAWFQKYKSDVFPSDFIISRGKKVRVPKYYDNILAEQEPENFDYVKFQRELKSAVHTSEQTYERLVSKEKVKYAQLNKLKRGL